MNNEQVHKQIAEIEGQYSQGLITLKEALASILETVETECDRKLELYKERCGDCETDLGKAQHISNGYRAIERFKSTVKITILPEGC